ncbi:MAG: sodium/glutamate symporter [Eubacteriales bacterium]|nr:sodium/glutamate symporter [Eubacteriales bacterium]
MYSTLVLFIKAIGILSGLLMLGTFLRAKVPVFQNLYLPASVIGGFIGLILGPNVLNLLPFSADIMDFAASLPSVLITPVFAAIPMCLYIKKSDSNAFKKSNDIIIMTCILGGFFMFQCTLGILAAMFSRVIGVNTYDVMGLELAYGFNGGHGMAASLGSALQDFGNPNWQSAQDAAMTTATVGLIGGIILGIIIINIGIKKGYTSQVTSAAKSSLEMRKGVYAKDAELPEMCKQTTVPNSIETLSLHLALIIGVSAIGYILEEKLGQIDNIIFASMSAFFYSMIVMLIVWRIIVMLKWDHHFNEAVKDKISGSLTDFIVVSAIMSINVKMLSTYWAALLITCVLGLVVTPTCILFICKKFLRTNWFEKSLGAIGANTGVFVTGILLIKMVDPDIKTDALTDYSIGGTLCNLYAMPLISLAIGIMGSSGPVAALIFSVLTSVACFIPIVVSGLTIGKNKE